MSEAGGAAAPSPPEGAAVHVPVLRDEVVRALAPRAGGRLFDGTLGAGGHAAALLPLLSPGGLYVGVDRDPEILAIARARLEGLVRSERRDPEGGGAGEAPLAVALHVREATFDAILALAGELAPRGPGSRPAGFDGVLLDVGVSSLQIDRPARGFSFSQDGPLDMRMGPDARESAADLLRTLAEEDLANVIFRYGEERYSRRIAREIVSARRLAPLRSTGELTALLERILPGNYERGRIHRATRTFQALRIAVNDELGMLERALADLPRALAPGGRAAIITFHSLEDRIVKQALRDHAKAGLLALETKKPLTASDEECRRNRRARSAKLRVAVRPHASEASAPAARGPGKREQARRARREALLPDGRAREEE